MDLCERVNERGTARQVGRGHLLRAFQPGVGDKIKVQQEAETRSTSSYHVSTLYLDSARQVIFTISFHFPAIPWYGCCYLHVIKADFVAQGAGEQFFKLLLC